MFRDKLTQIKPDDIDGNIEILTSLTDKLVIFLEGMQISDGQIHDRYLKQQAESIIMAQATVDSVRLFLKDRDPVCASFALGFAVACITQSGISMEEIEQILE